MSTIRETIQNELRTVQVLVEHESTIEQVTQALEKREAWMAEYIRDAATDAGLDPERVESVLRGAVDEALV